MSRKVYIGQYLDSQTQTISGIVLRAPSYEANDGLVKMIVSSYWCEEKVVLWLVIIDLDNQRENFDSFRHRFLVAKDQFSRCGYLVPQYLRLYTLTPTFGVRDSGEKVTTPALLPHRQTWLCVSPTKCLIAPVIPSLLMKKGLSGALPPTTLRMGKIMSSNSLKWSIRPVG